MDIDFAIDHINASEIQGWAWLPGEPDAPLTIELASGDGDAIHQVMANGFRYDLAVAAKRSGWCAFRMPIDPTLPPGSYGLRARWGDMAVDLGTSFEHESPIARISAAFDPGLSDPSGAHGWLDTAGPLRFSGWLLGGAGRRLELVADGEVVATGGTDRWRDDLASLRQGDGRCGFLLPVPRALCDGAEHLFDLRWEGTSDSLLSRPIPAKTASDPMPEDDEAAAPISRPAEDAPIELSIIVNFYNMPREAERTLMSLSRQYQRDVGDIAYEVLCIDNGSNPPMTEDEITRHGPEFRLVRPSRHHPSPVFALNEAAEAARGRYLAVMIDGAHLLSPGVIAEAIGGLREEKRAIVAVRHWFIGGDQRWFSKVGFSREQQDLPFARIDWPASGYDIFKISTPIHDSPNTWFDDMSESNCLFVSKKDFAELGGYDRGFEIPGGGFANLDLFTRAAALPAMTVISLIGEATFHQYHEGTTTNVVDAEKDRRVRRYAAEFEALRDKRLEAAKSKLWKYRGAMRTGYALESRQSPSTKVRLGLTSEVRRVPLSRSVHGGTRHHMCVAYVESGGPDATLWLGQPTGVAPADLIVIQRLLWERRPDALLMTDIAPGLLYFIHSILPAAGLVDLRLIWLTANGDGPTPPGVNRIVGSLTDEAIRAQVDDAIGASENVMALLQPTDAHPLDAMRAHANYVSAGDYLVVLGATFGQPTLGYSDRWISVAIHRFLQSDRRFAADETMNVHVITTCLGGFLRRVPESYDRAYDESLDLFEDA